jgi:IPTL-CTERM motif
MRRVTFLAACLGLASVAAAQKSAPGHALLEGSSSGQPASAPFTRVITPTIVSNTQNLGGSATLVVDISGEDSWDLLNDTSNTVLVVPIGVGAVMTDIGWDVNLSTVGGSWLSEARFYFDGDDQDLTGLFLTPGIGNDFSGSGSFSSGGLIDLSDNAIADIPLGDGNLYIQLHESFDDVANSIDANWTAGSTLTIGYEPGAPPPVPTANEWGLIALGAALLGGVVVVTMRRKRALALAAE